MESNLQNKLQQFSADPPERVWTKIADALDAEEKFPQLLYHYEQQPPAAAWAAIEQELEEVTPAKVIPFTTRFRKPLRFAAVASILTAVLITVTLTVKRTEAGAIDAGSNTTVPTAKTTSAETIRPNQQTLPFANDEGVAKQAEENKANQRPVTRPEQQKQESATASNKSSRNEANTKAVYSSLSQYVVFKDGDGKQRKVSKKMADFVNCKDDDLPCKQRLKQLRQKLAAKAMTTDFTGILDMLRQLQ